MAVSSDTTYLSSLEAELQRKRQELAKIQQQVLKAECGRKSQKSRRTGIKSDSRTGTRLRKAAGSGKHASVTSNPPSQKSLLPEQSGASGEKAETQELPSSSSSTARFSYGEAHTAESEIKTLSVSSVPLSQTQTTYTTEQLHSSVDEPVGEQVVHPQTDGLDGLNRLKRSSYKHEVEVLSQASNLVRRSQDLHSPIWIEGLSYPAQYLVRQTRSMSAQRDKQSGSVYNSTKIQDCERVCASGDVLGNGCKSRRHKKAREGPPGVKACKIASEEEQISSTGSEVGVQNSSTSEENREVCSSEEVSSIVARNSASAEVSTDTSAQKQYCSGAHTKLGAHGSCRDVEERCSHDREGFSGNSLESEACMGLDDLERISYLSTSSLPPTDNGCGGGCPGYPYLGEKEAIPGCHDCYSSSINDTEATLKVSIPITQHFPITVSQHQPPGTHTSCPGHSGGAPESTRAQKGYFPLFSPTGLSQEQQLQLTSDFFLPDDSFQALKLLKLQRQQQLQASQGGRAIRRKMRSKRARGTASSQSDTSPPSAAVSRLETLDGGSQTQREGWHDSDSQTSQSSSASQRSNLKPECSHLHPLHTTSLPPSSAAAIESSLPLSSQQSSNNWRHVAGQNKHTNECTSNHSETESDSYKRPHLNPFAAAGGKESHICHERSAALSDRVMRSPNVPCAPLSCSFARTTGGGAVKTSDLRHRVSLQATSEVEPTARGKTLRKVIGSVLVAEGGRLTPEGLRVGMCLAGALTVYTLAGAWGETETPNWDNCQRHSWTLGEEEAIHCCCMVSHETDVLLSAGGEFGDSSVRIYIAGRCGQYVLKCSSVTASADPPSCTALCSWLSAAASHSVVVVAALQSLSGGSEAIGMWTASRDNNLWVQTKYHTLPLPTEVGRITSLNHMTSHVTHQAEEEEESHDWVAGIGDLTLLLWDATEGTLLQTAALGCSRAFGTALGTRPVGLAAFREESTIFLLLGYQELDPAVQSLPQGSHDLEPQCSQPPPDISPQCVCWLLAVNARPSAGEGGGSGCGHPTHCRLVQAYSCPRMMDRNPVAMPPVAVCSPSGRPRHLALAVSHDTVLLWDLMHSDPWARLTLSGVDCLQSFYWLDDKKHLFLILDHSGSLHVFS